MIPPDVEELVKKLEHKNPSEREEAAQALGKKRHASAVPHLIKALQDPDDAVRGEVLRALGEIGDPRAGPHAEKALADAEPIVRSGAAAALGKLKYKPAIPLLVNALQDPAWNVKIWALWALGEIGDPATIPHQVKALEARDNDFRRHAVVALGKTRHEAAVPHVWKALDDSHKAVREAAAWAARNLGMALAGKRVETKEAKALQLVAPHLAEKEDSRVVKHALLAALDERVREADIGFLVRVFRSVAGEKPVPTEAPGSTRAKALKLVAPHFTPQEDLEVVRQAISAALSGEITEKNARLYVKQLRALKGKLK